MADLNRVHGSPATGSFYGLKGALVTVSYSGKFTADSVDGTTKVITEGGYAKAVKALEQVGSIIWLGAQTNNSFAAIVDYANFNDGPGATTSGQYGALADALYSEIGSGSASSYQSGTAVYTTLNGDGTWGA
jgi:hypothetical protein